MADKKNMLKNKLTEYKKELSFIKENISNKNVLKEYLNFQEDKPLPPLPHHEEGDEMIDREMERIPESRFKRQIDKMRELALEVMTELSSDAKTPEYEFFKKIWLECDKYEQKKTGDKIDENKKTKNQ